jgi:hypothetical protein
MKGISNQMQTHSVWLELRNILYCYFVLSNETSEEDIGRRSLKLGTESIYIYIYIYV